MSDTLHEVEAKVLKRIEEAAKQPKPANQSKDARTMNAAIPAVIAACL